MILIGIDEKNTQFLHENFEIEFYKIEEYYPNKEYEDSGVKKEKLIPLKFSVPREDEFLLIEGESEEDTDSSFVGHFFDVLVDDEIPLDVLCSLVSEEVKKNIYVKQIFNCEDLDSFGDEKFGNIYDDDELGEPC